MSWLDADWRRRAALCFAGTGSPLDVKRITFIFDTPATFVDVAMAMPPSGSRTTLPVTKAGFASVTSVRPLVPNVVSGVPFPWSRANAILPPVTKPRSTIFPSAGWMATPEQRSFTVASNATRRPLFAAKTASTEPSALKRST